MKNKHYLHSILCVFLCLVMQAQTISKDSIKVLNDTAFDLSREYSFGQALSYCYMAIQHATKNEDDSSLASSYHVLGAIYSRMQYRDKAKNYYLKALQIHQELENTHQIILLYNALSRLEANQGNYDKSDAYLEEGYKVAEATGDFEKLLILDWAKIANWIDQKKYKELLAYTEIVENRSQQTENEIYKKARSNYLEFINGMAYYHLGEYDKAEKLLKKHTQNEYVHINDLATSYKLLVSIYKKQGDQAKQQAAQYKYQENLQEKFKREQKSLYKELFTNYSPSKDQIKLDDLQQKNNQQAKIVNRFKAVLAIIALLLIGCIIMGTLIIKDIFKKIRSNRLLRIKQNKLEEAKLKAEIASKTKSNFFSMMSHELRTPLYAVTGITHILMEENPRPSQQQYLKSLKFSGDHLLSLVNNILQANKLEENTITIGASTFNLKSNINNIIKSFELLIKDRGNELHIAYDNEIPELLVGDSLKISQILINLISNAIKFTKGGTIRLSVEKVAETADEVQLHFCVQDTGVGIPKEKQEKVFEMFSQNQDHANHKYQGSGLGLSIVKKLLEVYDSKIHMTSKENVGTTFTFDITFPKTTDAVDPNIEVHIDDIDFSDIKMLVVDDNKINQMLTKKILSTKQIDTDIVASGAAAIEKVKYTHYDVILMDIHMPEMDGYEATKIIRTFNKEVPIIAFTAVSLDDSLPKIISSGMNDMLIKPFVASQLFSLIKKYVKNKV